MPIYARAPCNRPDCKDTSIGPNFACTRCGDYLCALHRFGTFHECANLVWDVRVSVIQSLRNSRLRPADTKNDHEAISEATCHDAISHEI
jgi:predicted nucleic acid binding AN1-type Zn finger protein